MTPSRSARSPSARLVAFARRQPVEELAHQYQVLRRFALRRRALVTLAFGIGLAYQPLWLALLCWSLDWALDTMTLKALETLDPQRQPWRYLWALATNMGLAMVFTTFPALSWLVDDPMAKAYALGLVLIALIHHSTLRNVHLPLSVSASTGSTLVAFSVNSWLWIRTGDWQELAITTLALAGSVYYAAMTIFSMHRLQSDLLHQREAARRADLAKTRFVAQLSHELRTPLNAIIGLSEAEKLSASQPETRARLGVLVQSARDMGDLLEDILDLSAIEAGQLPIRPAALELSEQIRATVQLFRRQFEDRGMEIDVEIDPALPARIWLDGRRLRQCLSNLLSNAIKYGRPGKVHLRAELSAPGWLSVRLQDNGLGVDEQMRERIFEPFVRGREDGTGTGLGLAISRTLARRMGGDLRLLPDGPGAQFQLILPFGPAPVAPPSPARFEGLRVLVVDDIATNRLVASTYLRLLGAEALQAADGYAALELVRHERPDLILMDLLMPGLDGPQTLEELRKILGADLPPVIALSAELGSVPPDQGFDAELSKPLTLEKLRETLGLLSPVARTLA